MNAIDANVEEAERDPELKYWFIKKPYANMYLMRDGTHRTRALKTEIRHLTAVRNSIFVRWYNLRIFAVPPKDRHLHYVSAPAFLKIIEAHRILCVPSPPMFTYYSSAIGNNVQWFGHLLHTPAMAELTVMSPVCFAQAAEYSKADLFMLARLRTFSENGQSSLERESLGTAAERNEGRNLKT